MAGVPGILAVAPPVVRADVAATRAASTSPALTGRSVVPRRTACVSAAEGATDRLVNSLSSGHSSGPLSIEQAFFCR